jgi:hypothetical protein
LIWSQNPGCFERHLQHKSGNPLFPLEARTVTQEQIDHARTRDLLEAEELRQRFLSMGKALDVRQGLDDALSRAAEVGGPLCEDVPEFVELYEAAVHDILASLHDNHDLDQQLRLGSAFSEEGRRKFNGSFVAQLRRADTPIRASEVIPSLLSETPETLRAMMEILSGYPESVAALRASASQLIATSQEARSTVLRRPEMLAILGLDSPIG